MLWDLSVFFKIAHSFLKENARNTLSYWLYPSLNMLFYNTASVLGVASLLLALLYLSKISVECLETCLLSQDFTEKKVLHVPDLKPTRNFSKPNAALVMRDVILLLTFSLYDCLFFLEGIYIIKVWTRT